MEIDQQALDQKLAILAGSPVFSTLEPGFLAKTAREMQTVSLPAGSTLLQQGASEGSGLYIVVSGGLAALVRTAGEAEQVVGRIEPGDFLGEIELLTGQPRTASVVTAADSTLLFLPKAAFETLSVESPALYDVLTAIAHQRMRRNQLYKILPEYFGELDPETMQAIEAGAEWLRLESGQQLVRYQETGSDFFILVIGKLQARLPGPDGLERPVGEILAGESVGEIGFFTEDPRTASVYATRDSDLVRFSRSSFLNIQAQYPQFTFQFAQQVVRRLGRRVQTRQFTPFNTNLCLVAAAPAVDLDAFAGRLAAALDDYTTCTRFNPQIIDSQFRPGFAQAPKGDLNDIRLSGWLDEQEKKYSFLVYQADKDRSNWTLRSLARADRVILIGQGTADPDRAAIQALLAPHQLENLDLELALLHDQTDALPRNTAAWLDALPSVKRHYHIRTYQQADFQRMARLLTGNGLGLVLGGGGARGFAHIGALRAMEEYGIAVDLVGGTSIGSIIGAAFAVGTPWQEIYEHAHQHLSVKKLMDYTFPLTAFTAGRAYTDMLKDLFADRNIEDSWIEYFCISSNLTTAEMMVHQRGQIWKYIRASSALPPVFPPVQESDDILIDGVMANNLPVDTMRQIIAGGRVIGVDVSAETRLNKKYEVGTSLSGWELLLDRLLPRRKKRNVPNMMNLWMRMAEFSSVRLKQAQYKIPDLMIRPNVENIDLFQLEAIDQVFELGYNAGREALKDWRMPSRPPAGSST